MAERIHNLGFSRLDWVDAAPGARYKACERDGRKLRLVEFTPEFSEVDWCRNGHVGIVLEGELEIDFGGRIELFRAGDVLSIAAGNADRHKARSLTPRVVLFLVDD
jgi:hypothetical protein